MGYYYQGRCLDTLTEYHMHFAQNCSNVGGQGLSGWFYFCTGTESGVIVQAYQTSTGNLTGTTIEHVPQPIPCEVSLTNQTGFMWELALILIAGFSIRAIIKAFQ